MTSVRLERQIRKCVEDLNDLVCGQGLLLTDPSVVSKSMELDRLILRAMYKQKPAPVRRTS
ncbi:aspartyl-phosphate phosphatase Spo0E family protein [Paenibacillus filicis]|uniref:Aspartyl-phosphate phosphatase Spo0E family protein n=1 Tax=Paenibacillus filicis TaxID=669464 RepID=A0ABU9DKE2_9BACL